jgi:hypothetical protein
MHRYRDAIYYTKNGNEREDLKKEVIAGYVLFPGRVPLEALDLENGDYHYQVSNRKIGIGAFPLRPSKELREENGSVIIDPTSSEQALRKQIRKWLEAENGREQLLEQSIPQRGLHYTKKDLSDKLVYVGYVKADNSEIELFKRNEAKNYYTGNLDFDEVDLQQLKYIFLDVDGVLNTEAEWKRMYALNPNCIRAFANAVKRCECGFNFNRKKRTLLGNLIFTLLIMVLLFVATHYFGDTLKEYDMAVKVICIYVVFVFVCKMLISSHNPNDNLSAEHEMLEKYKRKSNPIVTRNILIILGFIAAVGFLVYYYYFR